MSEPISYESKADGRPYLSIADLAVLLGFGGFAALVTENPQPGIDLHSARVDGDDQLRDVLEQDLERRRLRRKMLIGGLFTTAAISVVTAFLVMRPSTTK